MRVVVGDNSSRTTTRTMPWEVGEWEENRGFDVGWQPSRLTVKAKVHTDMQMAQADAATTEARQDGQHTVSPHAVEMSIAGVADSRAAAESPEHAALQCSNSNELRLVSDDAQRGSELKAGGCKDPAIDFAAPNKNQAHTNGEAAAGGRPTCERDVAACLELAPASESNEGSSVDDSNRKCHAPTATMEPPRSEGDDAALGLWPISLATRLGAYGL